MSTEQESTPLAIEIRGLTKIYRGGGRKAPPAVKDLSLEVHEGEVFGFIGPNGAGKSTTIKSLLGFLRPNSGTLKILGCPHSDISTRRRIGYLPEVASYYHFLTAREALWTYGRIFGISRSDLGNRVDEVLQQAGLADRADDRISTFSKGMTQRVGIAQALINDPDLLILDEPTSGLDPMGRREIRDLIVSLRRRGKTVFFSSHELSQVEEVCDRVAILRRGTLVKCGTLDELLPRSGGLEVVITKFDRNRFNQVCHWEHEVLDQRGDETTLLIPSICEMKSVVDVLDRIEADIRSIERRRLRLEDVFVKTVEGESIEGEVA